MAKTKKPPVISEVAFDNPFGRMAMELDPHCEGSPIGVMMNLISGFSAYIGPDVRVDTGFGTSNMSVWTVLVGPSGRGFKGATARMAMPIIERAFHKWAKTNVIRGVAGTALGFLGKLAGLDGQPVCLLEEEFQRFIHKAKRDQDIGIHMRKVWDGEEVNHKTGKLDIRVEEPHVGFIAHVQPRIWGAVCGSQDAAGGTYNRFLPVWVQRSKRLPKYGRADPSEAITRVVDALRDAGSWAMNLSREDYIRVPPDVAERYENFHRPKVENLTFENEALSEMAERAISYVDRLAGLFAVADKRTQITSRDHDSALAIVTYSVDTIRHVLPTTGGDSLRQKILAVLDEARDEDGNPMRVSRSELWDALGRNIKIQAIMAEVKECPNIKMWTGESTGGRPPLFMQIIDDYEEGDYVYDEEGGLDQLIQQAEKGLKKEREAVPV